MVGMTTFLVDGMPVAAFARERRVALTYQEFPVQLIRAFISAEDKTFFTHGGLDYPGIASAVLRNWRNRGSDKRPIGASTITQQVAKNLLSTHKETLDNIAQALLIREVLDANEVRLLMEGKPLPEKPRTPPTVPPQAAPAADPKVVRPEMRPAPGFTRGDSPAKA